VTLGSVPNDQELLDVPDLLRERKYAEAIAIVKTAKPNKAFAERLDRAIALVLPHAGTDAKRLYDRVKKSTFPYVHYLLAAYEPSHAARFVEMAPMGAAMVDARFAKTAIAERAKLDPHGHLAKLFSNAAAMESLFLTLPSVSTRDPGPHRRANPLSTDLRTLWGREPPPALAAWIDVLDHWDLGHHELGKWQAWNEGPYHRTWNPPLVPPANKNAIEWALALQGASEPWNESANDGTLNLLFANCVPVGRVEYTRAELGVFMGTPAEVLEIDREHDVRRIVAPDFGTFAALAPGMTEWKPKRVKSKSRAVQMATRAGWIVDLMLDIPQMAKIVKAFHAQADTGPASFDEPGDALYWLFHYYFTGDDTGLAHAVATTRASESKLVRDAATFVTKDKLAKKRAAFQQKLGKRPATKAVSGHPVDRVKLLAATRQLAPTYKAMPERPGGIDKLVKAMPDDLESYFEGLDEASTGAHSFAVMLAIARGLRGTPTAIKRNLELDDRERIAVYYGDLDVERDLQFGCNVVVLGNLTVGGTLVDTREFLYLWVTGNVKARFVHCQHKAWIGGKLDSGLALIGRRGTLSVLGGITADLALRDSDEGKGFRAKVKARHSIDTWAKDADAQLAKLRSILAPAAYAELEPGLFDSDKLVALAEKGKPYLRR
jgi:hypothetical protein